ncbi:hypothetical protein LOD99_2470 [Oopsacas minuta]|uniref:Uncharacterized protein n=1 Tax=Oopsacas minuta TaxID=111878 RepID=A0AAV7K4I1_9METZ|nr:hypothetical protein LOD99_2470 [Oopsacas minuta]
MATSPEALEEAIELDINTKANESLLPTDRIIDTLTLSDLSAPDTSQLDTFSLSAEPSKPSQNWQLTSYKKENERLRNQVVKLRKYLDSEKEQLKFIKKDAQETLVRVRKEERDTARHKHNELQLKLERQNQGQLKSSESHWQSEVVRLQGDIRQLRQETARLKVQQQNLEVAKRRAEEDLRKFSQQHDSEVEVLRRAGGQDLRKQHDELRSRDKELRDKKRELDHVNERALRMESKVDELEATLARLKGGLSLEKASPRALLDSREASIGDRSYSDVTTPLHYKEVVTGGPEEVSLASPVTDKDRSVMHKNAELSALAHRLDEKVKKLNGEKQELLDKLKKGQISSDPLKEDNRKLSSKCSDLSSSLRRTEEREKQALGEAKKLKLNQTKFEELITTAKQELSAEKSKNLRHKLGRQQLERAQVELKRLQSELTGHKDTIQNLEKEREDLKKRIDLLKHSKKLLSEERDNAMKQSNQLITDQNNASEKEWENASQASFIQAEMDQVIFERDELKASIVQLHLEHITLQRANSLLNELNEASNNKEESIESELKRSDELERIESELKLSNERIAELESELAIQAGTIDNSELDQRISYLTQSLSSTEAELSVANDRINELEGELQTNIAAEEDRQITVVQLHEQIEQLQQDIKVKSVAHEEELSLVKSERSRLHEQLDDKINRVTELEISLSEAIDNTAQLEARLDQLSSDKIEHTNLEEMKNQEVQHLETELKSAQEALGNISNDKILLSNEVSELRESLNAITELKDKEEVEREDLLERLEQVKQELAKAQDDRDQMRDRLTVAEVSLMGEQHLNEKIQNLEQLNKKTSDENAVLQMRADQLGIIECELETNRNQLERLRDKERELEGDIRVLKLEKEESQLDLQICRESLNKEISKLNEEKNNMVEAYSLQLSEAQTEIDHLRSITTTADKSGEAKSSPDASLLRSRVQALTQQLEEVQRERDNQEQEMEKTLLAKQTELDQIQYNLHETEAKLADALQNALQMSESKPIAPLDSPSSVCDNDMKRELKVHIEAALLNMREGTPEATKKHLHVIQGIIEHISLNQNPENTGTSDEFSFNNIIVEIDNDKEMMRQELAEFQEAFSALEEELEEARATLQSFQDQEKDLTQKNRMIQDLRSQVSDLKLIISTETQRNQHEKSSPGSLGDEHSITASLLDSPQSRFLEPRLFVTLFDYDPMSLCTTGHPERQLPLKAGDIIVVHGDMNATAHYQATHGGTAGLVPANFIEELIISDTLARQRLLHQSLSPEKKDRIRSVGEEAYSSSEDDNNEVRHSGVRIPMCVSDLCVDKVFQDSIVLSWEPPKLSSSGKSNGAYVLGYRALVNNEPKKDVIGALQVKCLLEGMTSGVPLTIQLITLSDNDLCSHPCTIQHPPIYSSHSRPSTASSHFSLPASLADTISPATSSSTILEPSHNVVAIYDYNAIIDSPNDNHEFELSFKGGDLITVFGCVMEDGFYFGELNGKKGLVPSNFVQEYCESDIQTLDTTRATNQSTNRPQSSDSQSLIASTPDPQLPKSKQVQVLALYSYDPYTMSPNENPEIELAFKEGDILRIQPDMDKYGFFQGEMDGIQGLIPSNFVTELDTDFSEVQLEQASGVSPLPEIFSDNDAEDIANLIQEKPRKGVFKKGKNFVKKLGRIGSPRNPKT